MSALRDFWNNVVGPSGSDTGSDGAVPEGRKIYYVAQCDVDGDLSGCLDDYKKAKAICDQHARDTGHSVNVYITNVDCPRPPDPAPDPGPTPVPVSSGDQDNSDQGGSSGQDGSDTSGQDGSQDG
jgi:hypothetical protein